MGSSALHILMAIYAWLGWCFQYSCFFCSIRFFVSHSFCVKRIVDHSYYKVYLIIDSISVCPYFVDGAVCGNLSF